MRRLIVGLGNPGEKYKDTRHNAGFIVVDALVLELGVDWSEEKKFRSLIAEGEDHRFVKPQTGMNLSGEAVGRVSSFFKTAPKDLVVVHDDVDFPLLTYKVQYGRESAGHKGVEDIIEKLGTKDFWRVRIGVGRPEPAEYDVEDFVLSKFTKDEIRKLRKLVMEIYRSIKQS